MELGLTGKSVIVTGASRGIGLAIAKGFAREGADVAICGRSTTSLEQAKAILSLHGTNIHAFPCDMAVEGEIDAFMT